VTLAAAVKERDAAQEISVAAVQERVAAEEIRDVAVHERDAARASLDAARNLVEACVSGVRAEFESLKGRCLGYVDSLGGGLGEVETSLSGLCAENGVLKGQLEALEVCKGD
jgi:outer membrane protein TolC